MAMKFDPRKLMEQAVDVMNKSIAEGRDDGKTTPKVGAVLWHPDGTIETSFRGELRLGDHAEYTLLERKNRDSRLDGSILFTTLEPCAPGARHEPKLGCAERIVLARIREVWVGITDPDPKVYRKGIKHLQDNGIRVHMFERDLQEEIEKANKEFLEGAEWRALDARRAQEVTPILLSDLEKETTASVSSDFSTEALQKYRSAAKISDDVDSSAFKNRLKDQGLVSDNKPTGFGILLFGQEPRRIMQQVGLLGTIHSADGRQDTKGFEGPQVLVPDQVLEWLKNKIPNFIDRTTVERTEMNKGFYEMIREGVVNAIVHRDYDIKGAKCQLVVTPETFVIKSPGKPVDPITLEQIQAFSAPTLSRNPVLHYIFAQMGMAEERGLGLNSLKSRATEAGLPLPRYSWEEPYLVLTLYRTPYAAVATLPSELVNQLHSDEKAALTFIASLESITTAELMKRMEYDERKAQRILKKLLDLNIVRRTGKGPSTRYEVVR